MIEIGGARDDEDDFDDVDDELDDAGDDTIVMSDDDDDDDTDNVGDVSVEINVEELIADIEGYDDASAARKKEIRRRLEELAEQRSLEDTYAVDFDDDD